MAFVSPVSNSSLPSSPSRQLQHSIWSSPPRGSGSPPEDPPQSPTSTTSTVESECVPHHNNLLWVGFNQDYGCFACGTDTGFRIYNCEPFKETFSREFNGGIGRVEMLFRCNILAIVGGGSTPKYPPNKVMIWDDHQSRCIGELSFRSVIHAVRLRRDRIVVVLVHKIYVYNFADLKLLQQIETMANPKGLCALSPASHSSVLACPGLHGGQVRVEHYGLKKTKFIPAHDSKLACFALTLDGRLLATTSTKGTLIRVFNTLDGTKLQELRRGVYNVEIYSLSFSSNAQWLATSSDKGTVHVFSLRVPTTSEDLCSADTVQVPSQSKDQVVRGNKGANGNGSGKLPVGSVMLGFASENAGGNPGSSLSFMKGVLPKYFSSEWSLAQFHLPEETKAIVAFGPQQNSLVIVGSDGSFYKCAFDPVQGGEMVQQVYTKFMRLGPKISSLIQ